MSENELNGNEGALNIILDAFQKKFNLGLGNNYEDTILNDTMAKLSEEVKNAYPEYFNKFEAVKQEFMDIFKKRYSSTRIQQSQNNGEQTKTEQPVEEKKTDLKTTTTQSVARANA